MSEKETFRAFTVRVPISQYVQMSEMAIADKVHLNKKVSQLLLLGMDKHISLDGALSRLLRAKILEQEASTDD